MKSTMLSKEDLYFYQNNGYLVKKVLGLDMQKHCCDQVDKAIEEMAQSINVPKLSI